MLFLTFLNLKICELLTKGFYITTEEYISLNWPHMLFWILMMNAKKEKLRPKTKT